MLTAQAAIEQWLRELFPNSGVRTSTETEEAFNRDGMQFAVDLVDGTHRSFFATDEALDVPPDQMLAALQRSGAGAIIQRDRSMRLMVTARRGVLLHEEANVMVDDRRYTVTRDEKHNVRIVDGAGVSIIPSDSGMRVMTESIFVKSEGTWVQEIRDLQSR
jgi:hypothetical protein